MKFLRRHSRKRRDVHVALRSVLLDDDCVIVLLLLAERSVEVHEEILVVGLAKEDASTIAIDNRPGGKHEHTDRSRIIHPTKLGASLRKPLPNPDYSGSRKKRSQN